MFLACKVNFLTPPKQFNNANLNIPAHRDTHPSTTTVKSESRNSEQNGKTLEVWDNFHIYQQLHEFVLSHIMQKFYDGSV